MDKQQKKFIFIEFIVCFGPVGLMLCLGLFLSPKLLKAFLIDNATENLSLLLTVAAGSFGLYGVWSLTTKILDNSKKIIHHSKIKLFMVLGLIALLMQLEFMNVNELGTVFFFAILPFVSTIHLAYVGREYLSTSKENKDKNES